MVRATNVAAAAAAAAAAAPTTTTTTTTTNTTTNNNNNNNNNNIHLSCAHRRPERSHNTYPKHLVKLTTVAVDLHICVTV